MNLYVFMNIFVEERMFDSTSFRVFLLKLISYTKISTSLAASVTSTAWPERR